MDATHETPGRRDFLRLLLFSGAATSVVTLPIAAEAKKKTKKPGKLVFRLQTRRHHSCNACKQHHKFTVFRTQALADANRAHPGCNCPVVNYKMPIRRWRKLLGPKGLAPGGVADLRRTPLRPAKG